MHAAFSRDLAAQRIADDITRASRSRLARRARGSGRGRQHQAVHDAAHHRLEVADAQRLRQGELIEDQPVDREVQEQHVVAAAR